MKVNIESGNERFYFDGEVGELIEATLISKRIGKFLHADASYFKELGTGKSYVLDSFEVWDDDDEPGY